MNRYSTKKKMIEKRIRTPSIATLDDAITGSPLTSTNPVEKRPSTLAP
jgi:hypothetical protein